MESALHATDMESLVVFEGTLGIAWFVGHMTRDRLNTNSKNIALTPEQRAYWETDGHKHVGSPSEQFAV
jgi:hypothetical protein